jgi:hypothetical protein
MKVELDAKIASGYHSDSIDKELIASEFLQLSAIRQQCSKLYELAKQGQLGFFEVNESKLVDAVNETERCLHDRYPTLNVLPHSRLRHFEPNKLSSLLGSWQCDKVEKARRLVDLVTVSVLLDAGAGPEWRFIAPGGDEIRASEGLAEASWELFTSGFFSTDTAMKMRVNSHALKLVSDEMLARGLQVSRSNPLLGIEGRARLLRNLGEALEANPTFFGHEVPRPGNMVDYLLAHAEGNEVSLDRLWRVCSQGLNSIWPLQPNGVIRGDVWTHAALKTDKPGSDLVPFHKLTQWLVYSVIDAVHHVLGLEVTGTAALTPLPEYRNGGLLIDTGVISLKDPSWLSQEVNVGTELIVEWRALTVVLIEKLADDLRKRLSMSVEDLPLAAVLEGGTWHAGRALAKKTRSDGSAPIRIRLDGTVF